MDKQQSEGRRRNAAVPDHKVLEKNGGKAGHEPESFSPNASIPGPNDLTGPAGDPAEGKRK